MSHNTGPNGNISQGHSTGLSKLTPEVVKKVTQKLSEMMGEDVTKGFEQVQNERGEFLNEDGLPIVDITEPLPCETTEGDRMELLSEDVPLAVSTLPAPVRERLRQQRDRILDQLEEEERLEQKREKEFGMEERQEILRKRKEAAVKEKEKLKEAKKIHKKMGKALVRNLGKENAQEEPSHAQEVLYDEVKPPAHHGNPLKKSVTFADVNSELEDNTDEPSTAQHHSIDWGDITPARLRSTGRPSLLSRPETLPMKMTVVERVSTTPVRSTPANVQDSDDESDHGEVEAEVGREEDDEASTSESELVLEKEEFDLDFAQHQREIALQYYEKRDKIGAKTLSAMSSHSHHQNDDIKLDIPLDMPAPEPEKPSISRFKASRLASSYNDATSPSTSLGASVVPAATARTLQKAIRTGKLDANARLVGGDADSGSETGDMQELLDLLKKGEVYNLGPDGNYLHVPPSTEGNSGPHPTPSPSDSKTPFSDLPPIDRPKTSKFKLSRTRAGRPSESNEFSRTDPKILIAERIPPKLPPTITPTVLERSSLTPPSTISLEIVEQSFRKPPATTPNVMERSSTVRTGVTPAAFSSMFVDSPSFPAPRAVSSTRAFPMVAESPSVREPSALVVPRESSRPSRPPTLISSVRETSRSSPGDDSTPPAKRSGKMSRFIAERS
ncbi:hypothetical protein H0H81_011277 [Sphagnurus paluster]|uniref:DUF3835 domain-containing protein n=1 Tax=Sphagnurus paluster TaxID=117069 RepID=A0A9P7GVJ7_9AGAR|nr:hypothetical protein H0H81_011277 [Sphagnurus paluster]